MKKTQLPFAKRALPTDGPLPSKMQQVPVPVINNTECENMYRRAGYVEHIPKIFICAGYADGKRDSCEVRSHLLASVPLLLDKSDFNLITVVLQTCTG